jgi:YggT family protein
MIVPRFNAFRRPGVWLLILIEEGCGQARPHLIRRVRFGARACRPSGQWLNVGAQKETFMLALIQTVDLALGIYWWLLIASAIFSWLYAFKVVNPRNQFVGTIGNFLFRVTEPVLAPIRRRLPDLGGIDISPIIVLLIIFFLRQFLWTTIAPLLV